MTWTMSVVCNEITAIPINMIAPHSAHPINPQNKMTITCFILIRTFDPLFLSSVFEISYPVQWPVPPLVRPDEVPEHPERYNPVLSLLH